MAASLTDVALDLPSEGVAVASFTGEHDLATSSDVYALLASLVSEHKLVVADFTQAQFVDSSVLQALLAANKLARDVGTSFRLRISAQALVTRAFEMNGLLETIPWASSLDAVDGRRPTSPHRTEGSDGTAA
jgi:anti-anti-sigma factor